MTSFSQNVFLRHKKSNHMACVILNMNCAQIRGLLDKSGRLQRKNASSGGGSLRDYIKFANIFWQTYKLPNYILPTFILPTLHFTKLFLCKLTIYQIHFAKLTFFRFLENLQISFILPNLHFAKPSFCQTLQFVVTLRMVLPLS